jgi:hypothetical protein
MRLGSFTSAIAVLALAVLVQAGDKDTKTPQLEQARGSVVGSLVCSKCNFKATEACQTALKLDEHQFVLVAGKAGKSLFPTRCSGKVVRVFGKLTVQDGRMTVAGMRSVEVKNQITLSGKLVCSKCDFKIGECAAALKAGNLQILLKGDAAKKLFKARCSGARKLASGSLLKIDGQTLTLDVSRIVDPKPATTDRKTAAATRK